ncbi:short-subunit dehydrogenase [Haloactinopolyspora alba]|uniref:Short-subunit dehydrogenase n=1 Tax=Haloactinopolyspora alba TaxID=648780 RepID=A0A2P8EFE9_9ACTN|nr:SDR family oxidoreductase [Haloactinopolyspora alba]PSL08164.1 short-subunit dehydrogenase [Haloactinopolyspora alba]
MRLSGQTAFVTGANRGIGRAFVSGFLARGASRVYAGVRDPLSIDDELSHDPRVEVVRLEVTDRGEITRAADVASDTTVLVNNAGAVAFESLLTGSLETARRLFDTNVFGPWELTRAFAPALRASRGAVVNVLSAIAWFSPPQNGAYGATKSAAWSLSNGLRSELAPAGVLVQGLHFGAVDTDFSAGFDIPKIAPEDVVRASLDGLEAGTAEVLVDTESRAAKAALTGEPNGYVRAMAG